MAFLKRACVALVILAACERAPLEIEMDEQAISVHSIVVAGSDSVFVFVSRARVRGEWNETYLVPVAGASVQLSHAGLKTAAAYGRTCATVDGGSYFNSRVIGECYVARLPEVVRSGETYELFVEVDGTSVHGSVQVPPSAEIISPSGGSGSVFPVGDGAPPLVAEWSGVGSLPVELRILSEREDCTGFFALPEDRSGVRFLIRLSGQTRVTIFPNPLQCYQASPTTQPAHLFLSTYDGGFDRYHEFERHESTRSENASVNLTGALGYFGAVANASVPITLVRQD